MTNLHWSPTLLKMASVTEPRDLVIHGRSIVPLLQGKKVAWDDDLFAEYSMHHGARTQMRAYRTPQWKLMVDLINPGLEELYHLQGDPAETRNLIASDDPEIRLVRERLRIRLHETMRRLNDPALPN